MRSVISVTAISWHIFICLFLAGTSWVGNLWALICRALENAQRVTAGSPGCGGQRREDLAVSSTEHGCCGKGPRCRGSARCHGNKDGSLIEMRVDGNPHPLPSFWPHLLLPQSQCDCDCPVPSGWQGNWCGGTLWSWGCRRVQGEKVKFVPWVLGVENTSAKRWWGQREPEEQAPRVSLPWQLWWEALWDIGVPRHCRKGVSLEKVIATWQHV